MSSIGNTLVCTGKDQQPTIMPPSKDPVFHQQIDILTEERADSNQGSLSAVLDGSHDRIDQDKRPIDQNFNLKPDKNNNNTQLSCKLMPLRFSNKEPQHVPPNLQTIQQVKISEVHKEIEILEEVSQDSQSGFSSTLPVKKNEFEKQDRVSLVLPETNMHPKTFNNLNFMLNSQSVSETQADVHDQLPTSQLTNLIQDSLKKEPEQVPHINWFKLLDWQTGKKTYVCARCNERFESKRDVVVHIQGHTSFDSIRPENENDNSDCDSVIEIFSEENTKSPIYENKSSLQDLVPPRLGSQISDSDSGIEIFPKENVNNLISENQSSLQDLVPPTLDSQISRSDSVLEILAKNSADSTGDNLVCMTTHTPTEQIQFTNGNSKHSVSNMSETHSDVPLELVNLLSDSILQSYLESRDKTKVFICAHCDKRIMSKSQLRVHMKKHTIVKLSFCRCPNCNSVGSNKIKIKDSKGRPLHLCHISDCGRTFRQVEVLERHLRRHRREKKFFCDDKFEREDHFTEHVQGHTILNHNRQDYNNDDQVSECCTKKDTLVEVSTDDIVGNMNRETQPAQGLLSPCLDFEVLECNPIIGALPDVETDYSESISNCKTNLSLAEQSQVSLQDLPLSPVLPSSPLRSNYSSASKTSSTCQMPTLLPIKNSALTESCSADLTIPSTCQTLPTLRAIYSVNNALRESCSADVETEYTESIFNCKTDPRLAEQSQVSSQDLLLSPVSPSSPLRSNNSSASSTSSSYQTLPTLQPIYSVNNALVESCSADGSNKTRCPNGKLVYTCHVTGCKKVFNHLCSLKRHMNSHGVEKNLRPTANCKCPNCSVEGGNKTRGSDGKLQHNCHIPDCGKIFRYPSELKKHLNSHSNEKFVCAHCHKIFESKDALTKHIETHENFTDSIDALESTSEEGKIRNSNSRSLHLCYISHYKEFSYVKVRKRHQLCRKGKAKLICAHCGERFLRKNRLAVHVREHMDFNETSSKNDNVSSQVVTGFEKTDTSLGRTSDNNVDTVNYEIQSSVKDLLSPSLDFTVSRYNPGGGALMEESTDYSEDSLDYFENCSPVEQVRVSIRDLLLPLLSKSKASSICDTRYLQDFLTMSRPLHSPKNSMDDMLICRGNNPRICKSTNKSIDDGIGTESSKKTWYVCPFLECKKIYRHAGFFKAHIDWHEGKKNFICPHCDREFVNKCAMSCHIRIHRSKYKDSNEYQYSTVSDINCDERLEKQLRWNGSRNIFVCPLCDLEFSSKDELTEHAQVHIIGQQNQFENDSFDAQSSQKLCFSEVEGINADYTTDILNYETQLSLQDLIPTSLNNYVPDCCSLIDGFAEVKTDNFVDDLTYTKNFSSFGQNNHTEDPSLICKTEYFVQDSIASSWNDQVSDCCRIMDDLPEIKTENFLDNLYTTSSSSLMRNPFHKQFLQPLPSNKKKLHPRVKISLPLSYTKDCTNYNEQESVPFSPNSQMSYLDPLIEKSSKVTTNNFVDNVSMSSTSLFERNQSRRQSSPSCLKEVDLSLPDVLYSMLNTSSTCEIQPYVENLIPQSESEETQARCQFSGWNSSLKTLLETNVENNVDDGSSLTSVLSQKQSDIPKQHSSPEKSNSLLNTSSICQNRSMKQDFLPLIERTGKPGLENVLISEAESRSIAAGNKTKDLKRISSNHGHLKKWQSGKKVFSCNRCDKKFVYLSDDKQIDQCPKCNVDGDKEMRNSNDKAQHIYSCSRCEKVFDTVATLSTHLDEHKDQENSSSGHSIEPAAIVNTSFERKELNKNSIKSEVSQISFTPKLQVLQERERTNCQHACHILNCGQVYNNFWQLKRHLEWHKKNYFCFHCNKGFVHKDVYIFHLSNAHLSDDKRIAQYPNCTVDNGKKTKTSNDKTAGSEKVLNLSKHLDEYSGQKNSSGEHTNVARSELNDNIIEKQVSQILSIPKLQALEENKQTVCGSKAANKTVSSNGKLKHVRRTLKSARLYHCYYQSCDKVFDSATVLQKHLDKHIGQKNWLCIYCDKKFLYKYELKAHVKTHMNFSENYDAGYGPPDNDNGTQLNNEVKPNNSIVSTPAIKASANENLKYCSNDEDDCICWTPDEINKSTRLDCDLTPLEVLKREHNYALPNLPVIPEHQVPDVCQETDVPIGESVEKEANNLKSAKDFAIVENFSKINPAHSNDTLANNDNDGTGQKQENEIAQVSQSPGCKSDEINSSIRSVEKSIPLEYSTSKLMKISVDKNQHYSSDKSSCWNVDNINKRINHLCLESTPLETSNEELQNVSSELDTISCDQVPESCQELEISSEVSEDHPADSLTSMKSISLTEVIKFAIKNSLKPDQQNDHPSLQNKLLSVSNTPSTCEIPSNVPRPLPTFQLTNSSDSDRNAKKSDSCMPLKEKFAYEHSLEISQSSLIFGFQMAQKQMRTPCQCPNCTAENDKKIRDLNGKPLHVCHITGCNKVFVYPNALKKHLELHYRHKDFFCVYCDKGFSSEFLAMKHLDIHRNPKKDLPMSQELEPIERQYAKCNTEDDNNNRGSDDRSLHACHSTDSTQDFGPSTSLTKQPEMFAGEQIFVCPYCPRKFTGKDVFMEHIFLHATEKQSRPRSPVSQGSSFSKPQIPQKLERKESQFKSYSVKGGSENNFVCPVPYCRRVFDKVSSLKIHLNWHSKRRKYFCVDCNKGFYREDQLKVHIKFHRGLCAPTVETSQKNKLMDRQYLSDNAKSCKKVKGSSKTPPYFCPFPSCKRVYKHFGHFKVHQAGHQGQNTFFCAHCDKVFEYKNLLARHIKTHANTEQVTPNNNICDVPILQSYYSLKPDVKADIESNNVEPQHICTVAGCTKIYYSAEDLSAHLKSCHKDDSYSIPEISQSHTSDIDSCNSECDDEYRFEASYLLDHQYSKREE